MADAGAADAVTVDAFFRGGFHLVQPAGRGHRAGLDALLVAAAVPDGFAGHAVDLGAGAGAAGLAVAARCPAARVTLVDNAPQMLACAERSLALPQNAHLRARAGVLAADVALAGAARAAAGLADNSFDFAIMNPPFNAACDRATPDALRRAAHVMPDGLLERWLRTAAAVLRPRGGLAAIARPQALGALIAACAGRFGDLAVVPVHPRADAAAIRVVLRARKGARGALQLAPPLVLHAEGRALSPAAEAIVNGRAPLFAG
ncbi:methyltransferase [Aquibium sp. A9E412]|uniref:tRNA1(Val) (adenine(37)-N6)-methyltransferase n=1 Tax=Aquibium sp. A9E412 TaxID=2976767 RepID=UPI0025AFFF15|nr:methyltransferase [Aquibium sp. A9E412]MDN2566750.1 methyltransferase [Aquibium sp. A9E412]